MWLSNLVTDKQIHRGALTPQNVHLIYNYILNKKKLNDLKQEKHKENIHDLVCKWPRSQEIILILFSSSFALYLLMLGLRIKNSREWRGIISRTHSHHPCPESKYSVVVVVVYQCSISGLQLCCRSGALGPDIWKIL